MSAAPRTAASPPAARQRAVADAAAIARAFVVPPGGQRLRKPPDVLNHLSSTIVSTALVDDVAFWRAPGRPQVVGAWEQAHLPRRFMLDDATFGSSSWDRRFSLTPIPGVLNTRGLDVEIVGVGKGYTAIRVDAQVSWQPLRPATERVPSATRVVTITRLPSLVAQARRTPAPVTITDLSVVRRLAALVDNLDLSTIGPDAKCPATADGGIRLTFLARTGGPPLAAAQGPEACGTVEFSVGGKQQPALQITDSFVPHILKLAGLHWQVR